MTWKQLESHDKTHWLLLRSFTQHRRGCRGGNKGRRFLPSTLNTMDRLRIVYPSQRIMFWDLIVLDWAERMVLIISKCGCVGAGSDLIRTPGVQHICRARLLPGCRVWALRHCAGGSYSHIQWLVLQETRIWPLIWRLGCDGGQLEAVVVVAVYDAPPARPLPLLPAHRDVGHRLARPQVLHYSFKRTFAKAPTSWKHY